jgi:hypothetical protein
MPKDCQKKPEPEFLPGCEGMLWPAFGSCSKSYDGLQAFWGDDLISSGFSGIGSVAGGALQPFMRETFVPTWNNLFKESERRSAVKGIVFVVTGALAAELVRE